MRDAGLVKELLLGVRAEWHLAVIEALLLYLLVGSVVVSGGIRTTR